jgi:hypothetical protein
MECIKKRARGKMEICQEGAGWNWDFWDWRDGRDSERVDVGLRSANPTDWIYIVFAFKTLKEM